MVEPWSSHKYLRVDEANANEGIKIPPGIPWVGGLFHQNWVAERCTACHLNHDSESVQKSQQSGWPVCTLSHWGDERRVHQLALIGWHEFLESTAAEQVQMIKLPDSLSITKEAYRPRTPDEEDVHDLYTRLIHAWNHHDAAAFAGLFAIHGLAIGFDGTQLPGRKEIESALKNIFKDHHTARYVTKVRDMRAVTKDVMMLRAVVGMVPAGEYDIKPALNAVQSIVALRDIEGWVIVLFQNTPAKLDGRPDAVNELTKELREILS